MTNNYAPGPKGHFALGSLPAFRRDIVGFLRHCAEQHGDMSGFRLAHMRCCLVNEANLIETVLLKFKDKLRKPRDLQQLRMAMGNGLLTNEGDSWRERRRIIQPAFHNERIRQYAQIMVNRGVLLVDRWRDGMELEIYSEMMRLSLDIVAESLFGLDILPHTHLIGRALENFMRQFEAMHERFLPLPMSTPTWGNLRALYAVKRMRHQISRLIETRRTDINDRSDLLAHLLSIQPTANLSNKDLCDEVVTLLLAGYETTATTLSWTLLCLAKHPDIQNKLRIEIVECLRSELPGYDNVESLTYTRQVIQESMRLYPSAWMIGREAREDFMLGRYRVRKGTQLLMAPLLIHRDPRYYDQPSSYIPERWTPIQSRRLPKYAYFPFGGGPRFCIGSNFALLEVTLLLAIICQSFHVDLLPGHRVDVQPSVTLRPRNGIRLTLQRIPAVT